jgi:divalent metal cation (Fe/Co/Zn/Cd) transporter
MLYTIAAAVEFDTVVTISIALLGVCGTLVGIVWNMLTNKVDALEKKLEEVQKNTSSELKTEIKDLGQKMDASVTRLDLAITTERAERTNKHDELAKRVFDKIERNDEKTSDLSETVAGIGAVYVTRSEFLQQKKN